MMESKLENKLFLKYDVPAPRYTSYPTVPYWEDSPTSTQWVNHLNKTFESDSDWSLYIHIPFCETLCTFCGCNTSITKNHKREQPYVELVLKEWREYVKRVPGLKEKKLVQFHLGGGTPTFLSADNLRYLTSEILKDCVKHPDAFEGSIEVDPRRTNKEQLKALLDVGFQRISLGVQDFDYETQRLVNRVQPFEITKELTDQSRDMGYSSINFDLIYGLPAQTEEKIHKMMDQTLKLRPDRIALYSLAIVPWIKPAQKLFKDEDLPKGEEKRKLYEISRKRLLDAGYVEIGMDHFALPNDALSVALKKGELHRNFMGYADYRSDVLLGLGVSAISETPECFHQNEKTLPVYEKCIESSEVASFRGHQLTNEDRVQREQILTFMTQGEVKLRDEQISDAEEFLSEMVADELVLIKDKKMIMTEKGHPFLRNACMVLDTRLREKSPTKQVFSKAL